MSVLTKEKLFTDEIKHLLVISKVAASGLSCRVARVKPSKVVYDDLLSIYTIKLQPFIGLSQHTSFSKLPTVFKRTNQSRVV